MLMAVVHIYVSHVFMYNPTYIGTMPSFGMWADFKSGSWKCTWWFSTWWFHPSRPRRRLNERPSFHHCKFPSVLRRFLFQPGTSTTWFGLKLLNCSVWRRVRLVMHYASVRGADPRCRVYITALSVAFILAVLLFCPDSLMLLDRHSSRYSFHS